MEGQSRGGELLTQAVGTWVCAKRKRRTKTTQSHDPANCVKVIEAPLLCTLCSAPIVPRLLRTGPSRPGSYVVLVIASIALLITMLSLELSPELEARLAAQARAYGLGLYAYATQLLEQAALPVEVSTQVRKSEELEGFLTAMAEGSEALPAIATHDFTRESFYANRG